MLMNYMINYTEEIPMKNNKQQTAVDLMYQRAISVLPMGSIDARQKLKETYEQAKEMDKKQAQEYAAFCVACDRKELPLLEFDGWVKLERGEQ